MKTFKKLREDGMGGGAAVPGPSNAVSTGAIAGTGGKGGEPGVYPKRKRRVIIQPMGRRNSPKM
jgi:hypothetical protein